MENKTISQNSLAETAKTKAAVNNSNGQPAAEEVVIYDECGDTMWDKVLVQKSFLELKANEHIGENNL